MLLLVVTKAAILYTSVPSIYTIHHRYYNYCSHQYHHWNFCIWHCNIGKKLSKHKYCIFVVTIAQPMDDWSKNHTELLKISPCNIHTEIQKHYSGLNGNQVLQVETSITKTPHETHSSWNSGWNAASD